MQVEIKRLTAELDRLTGPSSDLAKSVEIFKSILEELKKSPTMVDAAINSVIIGMNSQIDKLRDANSNVGTTTQELQKTQKSLSLSTGELLQTLGEFKIATKTLGDSVRVNTIDLLKSTGEISKVAATMQTTSATLSTAGKALSERATEVSQETEKLKNTTQGLQQTGKDLSERATEVSKPINDLKTATNDVQKGRDSFIREIDSLSKLISALKESLGEFVGTTAQLKTSTTDLSAKGKELEKTENSLAIARDRLSELLKELVNIEDQIKQKILQP